MGVRGWVEDDVVVILAVSAKGGYHGSIRGPGRSLVVVLLGVVVQCFGIVGGACGNACSASVAEPVPLPSRRFFFSLAYFTWQDSQRMCTGFLGMKFAPHSEHGEGRAAVAPVARVE